MIKWYDFEIRKPKKGWHLVHMDIGHMLEDGEPEITTGDLVCVAYYDPSAVTDCKWHSPIFDSIWITHWAKINLPLALDEPK